jgi:translocation and assembly module TamB
LKRSWLTWALKALTFGVLGLIALLVIAAAGLWWWTGTQQSLDWTLAYLARSQPFSAEGVQGSLRSGLQAAHLQWERDGVKVEAFDVHLAWQPLELMERTVKLDHLLAARLRFEDRRPPNSQPAQPPSSLAIPLRVAIDEIKVGQLQWAAAANNFEASALAGNYGFNGKQHQVQVDNLRWAGGTYSGDANLGARGKLPLEANVQGRFETAVPGSAAKLPLAFTVSLRGPLADLRAQALLETAAGSPSVGTRATVTARVTPWAQQPVPQGRADFQQLDVGAFWPQAPHTRLAGQVRVRPAGTATWALTADLSNETPGPWDQQLLPVDQLSATGEWRMSGQALVKQLQAKLGGGTLQASGDWRGEDGWAVKGKFSDVDPAAVHSAMAHLPVSGRADVDGQGKAVAFDVDLKANANARAAPRKAKRNELTATVHALELRDASARGQWSDGLLTLPRLEVHTRDATLHAAGDVRPQARAGSGRASLDAPGLQARADGKLSESSGGGTLRASSANIDQALRWLAKLPGVSGRLDAFAAAGRGDAQFAWQGGWRNPSVQGSLTLPLLEWRGSAPSGAKKANTAPANTAPANTAPSWTVRDAVASVNGRLSDAALQLRGRAEQGRRRIDLDLAGRGGRRSMSPDVWQGQVASLHVDASDPAVGAGQWTLALRKPVDLRWSAGSFDASAGQATLAAPQRSGAGMNSGAPATLDWEAVRWHGNELRTAGKLTGLPLAWVELLGGPQLAGTAVSGDMVFDGQWDANLGAAPRIRASLARSRGDLTLLADTAQGASTHVRAGVREARLSVTSEGDALTALLRWDSERGGTADGRLQTRIARGGGAGWQWPDSAPLAGSLRAQLPRIGVWSLLAPPGWRLRGSLATNITFAGTKGDPQLTGTLAADDLALRSVVDGIELQRGRLRAHLSGRSVVIDEFLLHGPGADGGTVVATGEGSWTAAGLQAHMSAQVSRLRASIRSDRQVTASGTIAARLDASGTVVNGNIKVDQALVVLPDQSTPKLGDDVVVHGAAGPITRTEARAADEAAQPASRKLSVSVNVDLGDDFHVKGMGIDTPLRGTVALSGPSITSPRLVGVIRAGGGEYQAYGQRLDIERGVIRFTGAVDNPSLDILAIRPNLLQRVGVQVTGNAYAPYIRLYAEPDMPDAEKLSWLITGRASASSGAEAALVQQAALALLASRGGGGKRSMAASLGLDELSFRREGPEGPAVTLGKRIGRNFYAAYERSLSGALGTLYVFYDLTRRVTVRAETGERTAVDLIFTFAFD